jgi:hypothetical protein
MMHAVAAVLLALPAIGVTGILLVSIAKLLAP